MPCRVPRARAHRSVRVTCRLVVLAAGSTLAALGPATIFAQFSSPPAEISDSLSVDEADSTVRAHLERVRAYLADQQWDEAVETLRQVMENHGGKMIAL